MADPAADEAGAALATQRGQEPPRRRRKPAGDTPAGGAGLRDTIRDGWRIGGAWFRSDERWVACALLLGTILFDLGRVGVWVASSYWNAALFNALGARDWDAFVFQLVAYSGIALLAVVQALGDLTFTKWLTLRWRRWLTARYLDSWLSDGAHYRMRLAQGAPDNPDQRIAEDVRLYVEHAISITVGVLRTIVSLASFATILASIPATRSFEFLGFALTMPVLLMTASFLYAGAGTWLMHLIGRRLIALDVTQQRAEADFRFGLARLRENFEEVALAGGEPAERAELDRRFSFLAENWYALLARERWLRLFRTAFENTAFVIPYLLAAPLYFSGAMPLGGMTQTANAFTRIRQDFSYLIRNYTNLAYWASVIERLAGFEAALASVRRGAERAIERSAHDGGGPLLAARDLSVRLPGGAAIVSVPALNLAAGEAVLLTGVSGAGKTSLIRALVGIWPFGEGSVSVRNGARMLVLPHRGYVPLGTLRDALAGPVVTDESLREMLVAVGLPTLCGRLDDADALSHLSGGERQRIAFARVLLQCPDILLLDESTSALDEVSERALYELLRSRLPQAAVLSIGHRPSLARLHDRSVALVDGRVEQAGLPGGGADAAVVSSARLLGRTPV